jgi:hypothetical protein
MVSVVARQSATATKKQAFLEAFAQLGTVTHAAQAVGIARTTHHKWLESDSTYAELFAVAREELTESLETEAIRRARDGVEEPVFYKGEVVGHVRKMSDTLMIFLLKANRPDKYIERSQVEHSGTVTLADIAKAASGHTD